MGLDEKLVRDALALATATSRAAPAVRAAALVGSWAAGRARPDSDVDLVFLVTDKWPFVEEGWMSFVEPSSELVRAKDWGVLTERRARTPKGLVVELGFVELMWAETQPIDAGTRRVVADGINVLYDPDGLLAKLVASVAQEG